jgi:hypothetical protein
MLDSPLYHDMLRDNTCMSQVEVDIPLHSFLDVGGCGTLLDLCIFQILLYLVLHLCILLDFLMVRCIEAPDYTVRGYTMVVRYFTQVVQCCTVVV